MIDYSFCITNYNNAETVLMSLKAIIAQIDGRCEIVVVDNESSDGSLAILQELADSHEITLIVKRSSRGLGRQIALRNSVGSYVVSSVDTDDVLKPCLKQILDYYHEHFEGRFMLMGGFSIAPRALIEELGGWRNLQCAEDWDMWRRAASIGKFVFVPLEARTQIRDHSRRGWRFVIGYQYYRARDAFRLGQNPMSRSQRRLLPYLLTILISPIAFIMALMKDRYSSPLDDFNTRDYRVSVPLELC